VSTTTKGCWQNARGEAKRSLGGFTQKKKGKESVGQKGRVKIIDMKANKKPAEPEGVIEKRKHGSSKHGVETGGLYTFGGGKGSKTKKKKKN